MSRKIFSGMATLCLTLMMMFVGLSAATPAKANPPVTDCTNGCVIVTCSGPTCTVWSCNSSGCNVIGSYANPDYHNRVKIAQPGEDAVAPGTRSPFDMTCGASGPCGFKTCKGATCTVFTFDRKAQAFRAIATTENDEYLIQQSQEGKR